jgi:aryl-alcohol dehydrogenase-like predicted oxidoreductase
VIPIPGTTRAERVDENADAVQVSLPPDELASLDALFTMVAGDRYTEGGMRTVNR